MDKKYGVFKKQIKASEMFGKSTINECQRQAKEGTGLHFVSETVCSKVSFSSQGLSFLMISEPVTTQIS